MNKKPVTKDIDIAGKTLHLEVNKLALQANTSVVARFGDTEVLVTVMLGAEKPMQDGGAPLTVDFVERLYAGGIIKGSRWVKREGKPTDEATLTSRMIDRSIRPFFPKDMSNEVQVIVTLLSTDNVNDHDLIALNAVSVALSISNIPWKGPVSAVRMGFLTNPEESEIINPETSEMEFSELDLVVTSGKDGVIMLEAGAKQLPEEKVLKAIKAAHEENLKVIKQIEKLKEEIGAAKYPYKPTVLNKELLAQVDKDYSKEIEALLDITPATKSDSVQIDELKKAIAEKYLDNPDKAQIPQIVDLILKKTLRKKTLATKKRVDGRTFTDIRPISVEVGLLPRTHGSALFQRGLTQVLSVVTLANPNMGLFIETAEGTEEKRYIHHYNAAPYSTGELGRVNSGPGRRDIGHGALAERALAAVIPGEDQFPYTIRVVSEVLSQNGSTSMGSTCGSTLALMDAGVPLMAPVSGIAMGLIANDQKDYAILTDLRGEEDFYGNMDFKMTGTTAGVTAIQLDIKLGDDFWGLSVPMIEEILKQAREGRMEILEKMLAVIPESRKNVSQFAPKVVTIQVPVEKIGEVIGPGGRNIKNIIATTGAAVDIDDSGQVTISSIDAEAVEKAKEWISGMTRDVEVGEEFDGEVKRILNFGAFVEFLPGKEGLVHVSKMTSGFVSSPEEVVHVGDKVHVKVVEIDDQGRINLAMYWGPKDTDQGGGFGGDQGRDFGAPQGGFGGPRPGGFRPRPGGFGGGMRRGGFSRGGRDGGGRRDRY